MIPPFPVFRPAEKSELRFFKRRRIVQAAGRGRVLPCFPMDIDNARASLGAGVVVNINCFLYAFRDISIGQITGNVEFDWQEITMVTISYFLKLLQKSI
jgi:hypothetical protein